jgi:hypothetical protein
MLAFHSPIYAWKDAVEYRARARGVRNPKGSRSGRGRTKSEQREEKRRKNGGETEEGRGVGLSIPGFADAKFFLK